MIETRKAFSVRMGVNKGTVTRWAQSGRLVLDAAGHVDVELSQARLQATQGGRADVSARHAIFRGRVLPTHYPDVENATTAPVAPMAPHVATIATHTQPSASSEGENKARIKAATLGYENAGIKLEIAMRRGAALELAAVKREAHGIGATLRAAFERLVDQAAPRLAAERDALARKRIIDREVRRLRWLIRREIPAALRRAGRPAGEGA